MTKLINSSRFSANAVVVIVVLTLVTINQVKVVNCLGVSKRDRSGGIDESLHGHLTLSGLFPAHNYYDITKKLCHSVSLKGIEQIYAMMFAIDKVNKDNKILPNVSLGYHIGDTCSSVRHTLTNVNNFVPYTQDLVDNSLGYNQLRNFDCNMTAIKQNKNSTLGVAAVIGTAFSATSLPTTNILGVFDIPEISFGATSTALADRKEYNHFFRTLPSDYSQAKVVADIVQNFGWTYIATVSINDIYGRLFLDLLKSELLKKETCIAQEFHIPMSENFGAIRESIQGIAKLSNVSVIVLIARESVALNVLKEAETQGLQDKTWIGTDAWSDSSELLIMPKNIVGGLIGIVPDSQPEKEFYNYFINSLSNGNQIELTKLVEKKLGCSFTQNTCKLIKSPEACTKASHYYIDAKGVQAEFVIDATNMIAKAIHKTLNCDIGDCQPAEFLNKQKLLNEIRNVVITNYRGNQLSFNSNGEIARTYSIVNLQFKSASDTCGHFAQVGKWYKGSLIINDEDMRFLDGIENSIPQSRCSDECTIGHYKVKPDLQSCCWKCESCGLNQVSNGTTSSCQACGYCEKPSANNTICEAIKPILVSWDHPVGIAILTAIFFLTLLNTFVAGVFIKKRDTAIVKASNRVLSALHIITVYFILSLAAAFVYEPNDVVCEYQFVLFAISITFCEAILLFKTNYVSKIFQSGFKRRGQSKNTFCNRENLMQILFIFGITLPSVIIVIVGSILDIPKLTDVICRGDEAFRRCESKTHLGITFATIYFCSLGTVCSFLAWRTRNLPNNFNEAKYICFCSICMWMICILTIPGYYGTDGVLRTLFSSLGVTCFALCVMVFLFLPKVYTIIFKPELNTTEYCLMSVSQYTFRKAGEVHLGRGSKPDVSTGTESLQISSNNNNAGKSSNKDRNGSKKATKHNNSNNNNNAGNSSNNDRNGSKKATNHNCNKIKTDDRTDSNPKLISSKQRIEWQDQVENNNNNVSKIKTNDRTSNTSILKSAESKFKPQHQINNKCSTGREVLDSTDVEIESVNSKGVEQPFEPDLDDTSSVATSITSRGITMV